MASEGEIIGFISETWGGGRGVWEHTARPSRSVAT